MKKCKSEPCFDTKSVRFGRAELSFFSAESCREMYNLGMVSGPVKKNKKKSLVFILFGSNELGNVGRTQSKFDLHSSKPVLTNAEDRRG